MDNISEMAATASRVLAAHPTLSGLAGVSIGVAIMGTSPARFRPAIALQLSGSGQITGVAAWATAFAAPVRMVRRKDFVEVTTGTVHDGHLVLAWNHLDVADAESIAARLGQRLDTTPGAVLDIDPADLNAVRDHELARS